MTVHRDTRETGLQRLTEFPAEVGFAVAGWVALVSTLLSAATIHLMLSQPAAVAFALVEPGAGRTARALAGLLLAALRDLLSFL